MQTIVNKKDINSGKKSFPSVQIKLNSYEINEEYCDN